MNINVTSKAQCNDGHNTKKEIGKLIYIYIHIHASLFRQGDFPFRGGTRSTGGTSLVCILIKIITVLHSLHGGAKMHIALMLTTKTAWKN